MAWTLAILTTVGTLQTGGAGGPYTDADDCRAAFSRLLDANESWRNGSVKVEAYCIGPSGERVDLR